MEKIVILNGFKESSKYIASLTNIKYVGTIKSDDGYSEYKCYETIK